MSSEDLISKCMAGGAHHDIIKNIEETFTDDMRLIDKHLRQDLKSYGVTVESIKISGTSVRVIPESTAGHATVSEILETYSRVYPAVDFLVEDRTE